MPPALRRICEFSVECSEARSGLDSGPKSHYACLWEGPLKKYRRDPTVKSVILTRLSRPAIVTGAVPTY